MAKLPYIELANGLKIPILHEDRNVIAIDKPQGWMLAPISWQNTSRNLFAALTSSVSAGDFWARSRNLKFIRFVHRLDAETSGVLLLVKAPGAVPAYTELFEDRKVQKTYLAVVRGVPEVVEWKCRLRIAPMQDRPGLMEINNAIGKDSETLFRVVDKRADRALVMCWPLTGRTHQIRLHLAAAGHPVWGDELYGKVPTTEAEKTNLKLALRSIRINYKDPFLAEPVDISADHDAFLKAHGFDPTNEALRNPLAPEKALEHPKARLEEARRAEKEARQKQRAEGKGRGPVPAEKRPWRESEPLGHERRNAPYGRKTGQSGDRAEQPAGDWQQDEDSGGFASEPPRGRGERPFHPRAGRGFDRGPRRDSGFGDRPPRPFGRGKEHRGPRPFEKREGGFNRRPAGGGHPDRSEREGGYGRTSPGGYAGGRGRDRGFGERPARPGFGRKPYGDQQESSGGGFRGARGGKPGFGRSYEDRGERRSFHRPREFDRGSRRPESRAGQLQTRPGVFPSSAKPGLKAGFHSSGFGPRAERRPFRSSTGAGRPQGKFPGPRGPKGKFSGGKFAGSKQRGGGGTRPSRGFGRGPR